MAIITHLNVRISFMQRTRKKKKQNLENTFKITREKYTIPYVSLVREGLRNWQLFWRP